VDISVNGAAPVTAKVNQKKAGPQNDTSLGRFKLVAGSEVAVTISNAGTDGYVIADGVQLVPAK
jgi:hypothetical protein